MWCVCATVRFSVGVAAVGGCVSPPCGGCVMAGDKRGRSRSQSGKAAGGSPSGSPRQHLPRKVKVTLRGSTSASFPAYRRQKVIFADTYRAQHNTVELCKDCWL